MEDRYQLLPRNIADMYVKPLEAARIRLRAVQKPGLIPVDAKRQPIRFNPGFIACLNLLSTLFYALSKYIKFITRLLKHALRITRT
jgi:hypothetical protein